MNLNFKNWLESVEVKKAGIKDTIINFLKDSLNVKDEEVILSMNLSDIDSDVVNDLLRRGMISQADSNTLTDIKNGSITVSELIDRLASTGDTSQQLNLNISGGSHSKFDVVK